MLTNCNSVNASGSGSAFQRAMNWLCRIDFRLPLSQAGLYAGLLGGALYTLVSAPHMTVQSQVDLYVVGLMLATVGGAVGWITGTLIRLPLSAGAEEWRAMRSEASASGHPRSKC